MISSFGLDAQFANSLTPDKIASLIVNAGKRNAHLTHPYLYCFNNSINFTDPLGLDKDVSWWQWAWKHGYFDVGVSFSATGTLGPGLNFGFKFAPTGLYGYGGFGLGIGGGFSATLNMGTPPSQGVSVVTTVRGGTGWGGKGSFGVNQQGGFTGGAGGGFGVLGGVTVTAIYTHRLIPW